MISNGQTRMQSARVALRGSGKLEERGRGRGKVVRVIGGGAGEETYLATPPGTLQGSLETKKDQWPRARHSAARRSRSKSSPIGHPHPPSSTSCSAGSAPAPIGNGHRSNDGWSPATAEKFSQIHRSTVYFGGVGGKGGRSVSLLKTS